MVKNGFAQIPPRRRIDPAPSNLTWRYDVKKIKFTCSNCEAKLRVPTHLAGVSAPCPKCGSTITAPTDLENVVDDSPVKNTAPAPSSPQPEMAGVAVSSHDPAESGAGVAPVKEPTVSVSASGGSVVVGKVMQTPANEATPTADPASQPLSRPAEQELPAAPPVSTPEPVPPAVEDVPVVEETILIDPPAPEFPEVGSEESPAEPPVPTPPTPVSITPPPAVSPPYADEVPVETELESPPAVPETQPIRVNHQPSHLPPVRGENVEAEGELPRLDINLAENADPGPDSLVRNPASQGGPTRVQLPQPGAETESFSPDDFIVPASADTTEEVAQPPLQQQVEETPVEEFAAPAYGTPEEFPPSGGVPLDEIDVPGENEATQLEGEPDFSQGTGEYVPLELPPMQEAAQPVATPEWSDDSQPGQNFIAEAASAQERENPVLVNSAAAPVAEGQAGGLSEGSMENMLSPQPSVPDSGVPEAPGGASQENSPESAPGMTEIPAQTVPQAESRHAQTEPVKSERDVLDEMFGGAPSEKGTSKSTVVMLSILGATALIAIVVVAVGIKMLGGFSPQHGMEEPPAAPAAARSQTGADVNGASSGTSGAAAIPEPSIDDAPAVIDPVAQPRAEEAQSSASTVTLPGAMDQPVRIVDASASQPAGQNSGAGTSGPSDPPALSIDERVQQIMDGDGVGQDALVIGGAGTAPADPIESALQDFGSNVEQQARDTIDSLSNDVTAKLGGEKPGGEQAAAATSKNYNPPASFPAPAEGSDDRLGETHNLLDAFLRAPDWETRLKYVYRGESLRPAMEEYYKKYEMKSYDRFSKQLFQFEADKELGGPYWVYLISTQDDDQGYPLIIRVEDGLLKVDWEIYAEFEDRHFVKFQRGSIASPATVRLVVERVSDYYGSDRDGFENLDDYYVYQVNPPYGDLNEFSDYAFVKADSEIAKELDKVVGLGDQPLAVIVTLSQEAFSHGVKHLVITDYVTEGWFR